MSESLVAVLGPRDVDAVAGLYSRAFDEDPVWSYVFNDASTRPASLRTFFGWLARAAVGYGWLHGIGEYETATLWAPPGRSLVTEPYLDEIGQVVSAMAPGREEQIFELFGLFEEHHPEESHYYLSVIGTDPAHRGRGVGISLLTRDLEIIDATHQPCYLESSNPRNEPRYRSVGFEATGVFRVPGGGPPLTMMWREAR